MAIEAIIRALSVVPEKLRRSPVGYQAVCTGRFEGSSLLPFISADTPDPNGCSWVGAHFGAADGLSLNEAFYQATAEAEAHQSVTASGPQLDTSTPGGFDIHRVKIVPQYK